MFWKSGGKIISKLTKNTKYYQLEPSNSRYLFYNRTYHFSMIEPSTEIIQIPNDSVSDFNFYKRAASLIQQGELVAFPTETVYGIGANALSPQASLKIFRAKNRPIDNPLIVHVSDMDMLKTLVDHIPTKAQLLIDKFWPGPLTILFPKSNLVPDQVSCGHPTVAVRMPSNPIAHSLIKFSNCPIAAPSANISGRPSPTSAQHVYQDMKGKIQCILDGGQCKIGLESTVIDISKEIPLILRPGGITLEKIREILPLTEYYDKNSSEDLEQKPPTPGLKYRHYSPNAEVILYEGSDEFLENKLVSDFIELKNQGHKIGVIETRKRILKDLIVYSEIEPNLFIRIGDEDHPQLVAQGLFAAMRKLDDFGVEKILMEGISENSEGMAVMNRARKAASLIVKS